MFVELERLLIQFDCTRKIVRVASLSRTRCEIVKGLSLGFRRDKKNWENQDQQNTQHHPAHSRSRPAHTLLARSSSHEDLIVKRCNDGERYAASAVLS